MTADGTPTGALKSLAELTTLVDELIDSYTATPLSISQYLEKAINCYAEFNRNVKLMKSGKQPDYEELFVYYTAASRILSVVIPSLPEYPKFAKTPNSEKFKLFSDLTELLYTERQRMDRIKLYIRGHSSQSEGSDVLLQRLKNLKMPATPSPSPSPETPEEDPAAKTDRFDAVTESLSAKELNALLRDYPKDILLIDLRRRRDFENNHVEVACVNIISIEPVSIRKDYSAADVQKMSLSTSPDTERAMFERRSEFELVVVYDWSSSVEDEDEVTARFLGILKSRTAGLKRPVALLEGGFHEWLKLKEDGLQGKLPQHGEILQPIDIPSKPMMFRKNSLARRSSLVNEPESLEEAYYRKPTSTGGSLSRTISNPGYVRTVNEFFSSPKLSNSPVNDLPTHYESAVFPPQFAPPSHKSPTRQSSFTRPQSPPKYSAPVPVPPPKVLSKPRPVVFSTPEQTGTVLTMPPPVPPKHSPSFHESLDVMTGLANLGNTCYMNCTLQCLFGTKKFDEFFLNGSYKAHININSRLGSKGILAKEFNGLITEIFVKSNNSRPTYISPLRFRRIIASLSSNFRTAEQQDCSEFLNFLLDGLHEDLNECGNHPPLPELTKEEEFQREKLAIRVASTIEWERYLKTNFSIVVDIFQGQYLSRLECTSCHNTSTTYNAYSILSLPIPESNARKISLGQCFDEFCSPEVLDGDDRWLCPHCKRKNRTTKTMMISRLPEVLIIHLKRFKLGNYITKLNTFVDYPVDLSLDKYWPKVRTEQEMKQLAALPMRNQMAPFNYKLFGVVNHYGNLVTGHYTSYVDKGSKNGWCYFDDTKITKRCNIDKVINNDAYVLFYART